MVDAFMSGEQNNDGWTAMPADGDSAAPMMQMQSQEATEDVFADAAFPASAPVVTIITASGAAQNLDDDLTEEEKEIVRKADEYQASLKEQLHNKMMDESRQKNEAKAAGLAAVNQWHSEREGQIQLRKSNNESMEHQFMTRREDERSANNPWERVTDNCDLSLQGVVAGGHDKSRMKQAMLNRKADISAGETVVASSFGTNQL